MDPIEIIDKYYQEGSELRHILLTHSRSVADKAVQIPAIPNCRPTVLSCTRRPCSTISASS